MKMKGRSRKFVVSACVFALSCAMFFVAGCAKQGAVTEINMDDLSGVRVGVNLAWESDYLMTERGDAEVYRYDSTADMLMALNYNKIDAVALDWLSCKVMQRVAKGLEIVEPPAGTSGYILYFRSGRQDLRDDFNEFFEEFKNSDAYSEYMQRVQDYDGGDYEGPEIEAGTGGDGPVVKLAVGQGEFPRAYFEPDSDEPVGYDVEIAKCWARSRNLRIEWIKSDYEDSVAGLLAGKYDAAVGYLSDFYRDEAMKAGLLVSDAFCDTPIYLVRKGKNGITISGDVE